MNSMMKKKDWSSVQRRAMTATEIVTALAKLDGWQLSGEGPGLAIEKHCTFSNYHQTMAFVNAVAFIAHRFDHHPDLTVTFKNCIVRFNTHDVGGISSTDFDCASAVDALLQ